MIPFVSKIRIYPIKSFDPVILEEAVIGNGCLLHDREFALFNEEGKFVNGKRTNRVNEIRSDFDLDKYEVTFKKNGETFSNTFNLIEDGPLIEDFLSDFFGFRVFFARCSDGRFLDVPQYSGVTIGSKASLKKLTEYFPDISKEQMRLRFRANIELSDTEPFWEDKLFSDQGEVVEFEINDIKLYGISPRARCIVPTRDASTGFTYNKFTKIFSRARKETLPGWSELIKYDHYYYLNVDTLIPGTETGKKVKTGDKIRIIGKRSSQAVSLNSF